MNLATARAIIADSSRAPHMGDWMLAGQVLYRHWQQHPELLKPVSLDAKPAARMTRDAKPTRKVLRLDRDASVYRVTTDPDGVVWLIEEGAQTGKPPPPAEPDLMEADPALADERAVPDRGCGCPPRGRQRPAC